MDSHAKMNISASEKEQNAKLMAELAREEARNAEAIRMVKEKELQALAAKDRYIIISLPHFILQETNNLMYCIVSTINQTIVFSVLQIHRDECKI